MGRTVKVRMFERPVVPVARAVAAVATLGGGGGVLLQRICCWCLLIPFCAGAIEDTNGDEAAPTNLKLKAYVWNDKKYNYTQIILKTVTDNHMVERFRILESEPLAECENLEENSMCNPPGGSEAASAGHEGKGDELPGILRMEEGRVRGRRQSDADEDADAGASASSNISTSTGRSSNASAGSLLCYVCRSDVHEECKSIPRNPSRTQSSYLQPCPDGEHTACRVIVQEVDSNKGGLSLTLRECARDVSPEAAETQGDEDDDGACYKSAFGTQTVCECFTSACNGANDIRHVMGPLGNRWFPLMLALASVFVSCKYMCY